MMASTIRLCNSLQSPVCAHLHCQPRRSWKRQQWALQSQVAGTLRFLCRKSGSARLQLTVSAFTDSVRICRVPARGICHKSVSTCAAQAAQTAVPASDAKVPPNTVVLDKLISVFAAKTPKEWRKLIAHSKQWPDLAGGVLQRLQQKCDAERDDGKRMELKKLFRRLESVHIELQQHSQTLKLFQDTNPIEWEGLIVVNRQKLSNEFFNHVENLIHAAHQDQQQREDLIGIATRLIALVQAFDTVAADEESLNLAQEKFKDLLEVGSLQEMDAKLDQLSASGGLDPALLLTLAKAHTSVKDTDYTKEEVKDVMAHLYFKAKETLARQQPPEVRILKHLLTIESQSDRRVALEEAFQPGAELSTETQDLLSTTPDALMQTIEAVLKAFDAQSSSRGMVADAASLMNPEVIKTMRELQQQIRKQFM